MQVYIEGPYGAPMVDVHSAKYKCFVLMSTGMGWTFVRAWKRQLCQESHAGRPVKLVRAVAVMRGNNAHALPEFFGWHAGQAATAGVPGVDRSDCAPSHAGGTFGVLGATAHVRCPSLYLCLSLSYSLAHSLPPSHCPHLLMAAPLMSRTTRPAACNDCTVHDLSLIHI